MKKKSFLKNCILGIDLGTTNSAIAIYQAGKPRVIKNSLGESITPSVVGYYLDAKAEEPMVIVGKHAKRQAILQPASTFYSVKRFIGLKYSDFLKKGFTFSYNICKLQEVIMELNSPFLNEFITPEKFSSFILRYLVGSAKSYLNKAVTKAIITVPAYFTESQRQATKRSGVLAGLDVVKILNEPTAAALAYGFCNRANKLLLVFDLGGGTLDVSILELGSEVFEVLSTSGDSFLGGDDFDLTIINWLLENFNKEHKINLSSSKESMQRIRKAAEAAKIGLSRDETVQILLPFIAFKAGEGISLDLVLSRKEFEKMSKTLIDRCKDPIIRSLKAANLSKNSICEILLVGNSSKIPAIKDFVFNFFGKSPINSINPEEVVALGAAIQGAIFEGSIKDLVLLDVTAFCLGVELDCNFMEPIIESNTPIPTRKSKMFAIKDAGLNEATIHIVQTNDMIINDSTSLGCFALSNINMPANNKPILEISFQLNLDGLLSISAIEIHSRVKQIANIRI